MKFFVASIPEPQRAAWTKHQVKPFTDKDGFEKEFVRHVETTLARSLFNCDEGAAYSATSLAFRDRLITEWNKTQQRQTFADSKRVYYLSLEFLMGRALDNAILNVGMKNTAKGTYERAWPSSTARRNNWQTLTRICRGREGSWISYRRHHLARARRSSG